MTRIITLLFCSLFLLNSCQNKPTTNNIEKEDMINIKLIKEHLKLQEKMELSENDTNLSHRYNLTDTDIGLGGEIVQRGLLDSGYKFPSKDEFQKKVNTIFHINFNDEKQDNTIFHKNFITYLVSSSKEENQESLKQTEYDYTCDNLFFFNKYGFITEIPLLGDIIKVNNDDSYQINIPRNIVARNKYLFNASNADLVWLLFNDKEFLKTLLVTFNYDKEPKITKMVLTNFDFENVDIFHRLIFDKINGRYKIRENIINDIEEIIYNGKTDELLSPAKEGNGYNSLSEIIEGIYNNPNNYINSNKTIAFLMEKSLDVGNLGISQGFLHEHEDYKKELETNNYYNYERLKIFSENLNVFGQNEINYKDKESGNTLNLTSLLLHSRPDFGSFAQEITVKGEVEYVHNISGWDFVKVNGTTGYLPSEALKQPQAAAEKSKHSFLADDDDIKPEKKKGLWGNLFG